MRRTLRRAVGLAAPKSAAGGAAAGGLQLAPPAPASQGPGAGAPG